MNDLKIDQRGHALWLTIDRPERRNAISADVVEGLRAGIAQAHADPQVRAIVITGAGDKAFCAGADLKNYTLNFARVPAPEFRARFTNGPGFGGITRNLDINKPIVAAINGFAISGGFELALACDLRFCSPNAEFALQDPKWGFHACDGGLIRLPQIVGLGHAMEIILSGERFDAEHAYRIGLVNRIFPQADLLQKTLDYAQMLAKRAPLSHRFAKEVMRRSMGMTLDEALKAESRSFKDVAMTADLEEGLNSFRERRDAVFVGR